MFDVPKIIRYFGDVQVLRSKRQVLINIQTKMGFAGCKTKLPNLEIWCNRKTISSRGLHDFARLARYEGRDFDLTKFIL